MHLRRLVHIAAMAGVCCLCWSPDGVLSAQAKEHKMLMKLPPGQQVTAKAYGDFNGDGKTEYAYAAGKRDGIGWADVKYWIETGSRVLCQSKVEESGPQIANMIACDLDGDKRKELLLSEPTQGSIQEWGFYVVRLLGSSMKVLVSSGGSPREGIDWLLSASHMPPMLINIKALNGDIYYDNRLKSAYTATWNVLRAGKLVKVRSVTTQKAYARMEDAKRELGIGAPSLLKNDHVAVGNSKGGPGAASKEDISLAGIKLGDKASQVKAIYGSKCVSYWKIHPNEEGPAIMYRDPSGRADLWVWENGGRVEAICIVSPAEVPAKYVATKSFIGARTLSGIALGSSQKAVTNAYGKPTYLTEEDKSQGIATVERQTKRSRPGFGPGYLVITMKHGKVMSIRLFHEPG